MKISILPDISQTVLTQSGMILAISYQHGVLEALALEKTVLCTDHALVAKSGQVRGGGD